MDTLTHTLTGVALSRAGLNRISPYATGVLILSANAPDIDVIWRASSTISYLAHHRGISHSFAASPLLAAAVVGLFWLGDRWHRPSACAAQAKSLCRPDPFRFWPALLVAFAGVLSHLLLDFTTAYGTRLLLPFSGHWFAWDIMPIVDLWMLAMLAAGLSLPGLFRLVNEEIGSRGGSPRPGAIFALLAMLVWWGLRDLSHRQAVATVNARLYQGLEPRRVGAYPDALNPFLWHGVVDTGATLERVDVNVLQEFDPTRARTFYPPEPQPALEAARKTRTARIFLDFAAFPYTYVDRTENGCEVVFRDLRFDASGPARRGFVARVVLDERLQVVGESFHFRDETAR